MLRQKHQVARDPVGVNLGASWAMNLCREVKPGAIEVGSDVNVVENIFKDYLC